MPTFDFTSPDGKSYSVDGPDGATPEQAFQILQQHLGGPKPEGSSIAGAAKSLGVGLAQGAIGLAGLPADIAHLYADNPNDANPLGSEGLQKKVEQYTGDFYKPQGRIEQLANTAGQFLPAAIGGPETLGTKLATRVAAPAIASEAAGALTGDNPYAKATGAVVGAMAGPAAFNRAVKAFKPAAAEATLDDIKAAARAGYQHQDVKDVRFAAQPTEDLANNISVDLRGNGFRPNIQETGKPVFELVDELRGASNVSDLDSVRRALGNIAKQRDPVGQLTPNAIAANKAIEHISDFLPNLKQSDLLAGNAQKANAILDEARQNWGAYKRAQTVQTMAENAAINASAAHSGGNLGNATRQAFKPFVKNNFAKAFGYTDEEKAALKKIVSGTWTGAATRAAGNLLGGGGGLGMVVGGAAGYHEGGLPGAIGTAATGFALKKMSNKSTLNAVAKLDRMLRSRAPEAIKMAANAPPQVLASLPPASVRRLQALIAVDPVLSQQIPQPVQNNGQ
jgi:hypothetical protein